MVDSERKNYRHTERDVGRTSKHTVKKNMIKTKGRMLDYQAYTKVSTWLKRDGDGE